MSDPDNALVVGDDPAVILEGCQGYYFDLTPVLAHCESLQRHPDRAILMCQNQMRALAPGELMLARSNGFYLIMQSCAGATADALANEINLALLALFFGTDSLNGITALFRAVAYGEMLEAGITTSHASPASGPVLGNGGEIDPLIRFSQDPLKGYEDIKSGFLPVLNLQREAPSIYMCGAVGMRGGRTIFGPAVFRDADPRSRPAIDTALLEYCVGFVRKIIPTKFAAAICSGVSFETLAWSRGRQLYLQALRTARMAENPFLIIKIEDVPVGTTNARLAELVAMVRPFAKRVFVQLPDCEVGIVQSGRIGATALCGTLPPNASPPAVVRLANQLSRVASMQQALSCVDGMACSYAIPLLRAAGIRFATAYPDESNIHVGAPPLGQEWRPSAFAA